MNSKQKNRKQENGAVGGENNLQRTVQQQQVHFKKNLQRTVEERLPRSMSTALEIRSGMSLQWLL